MDCYSKAVIEHCGVEAAGWVRTINVKYLKPSMDDIGCYTGRTAVNTFIANSSPYSIHDGLVAFVFYFKLNLYSI